MSQEPTSGDRVLSRLSRHPDTSVPGNHLAIPLHNPPVAFLSLGLFVRTALCVWPNSTTRECQWHQAHRALVTSSHPRAKLKTILSTTASSPKPRVCLCTHGFAISIHRKLCLLRLQLTLPKRVPGRKHTLWFASASFKRSRDLIPCKSCAVHAKPAFAVCRLSQLWRTAPWTYTERLARTRRTLKKRPRRAASQVEMKRTSLGGRHRNMTGAQASADSIAAYPVVRLFQHPNSLSDLKSRHFPRLQSSMGTPEARLVSTPTTPVARRDLEKLRRSATDKCRLLEAFPQRGRRHANRTRGMAHPANNPVV